MGIGVGVGVGGGVGVGVGVGVGFDPNVIEGGAVYGFGQIDPITPAATDAAAKGGLERARVPIWLL
jgi:hypothetical protein